MSFRLLIAALFAVTLQAGAATAFFDKRVAPILTRRCLPCHNNELKNGGISFLDPTTLRKGGSHGPAIVPSKPEASYLILTIQHTGDVRMPPGPKLPPKEIRILTQWIQQGAQWGKPLNPPR